MKRLKKILKWTGIVLIILAPIILIANAIFVWTTGTRLERQLAAIREKGEPLTLADLAREPIPPEKNAATYLRRAEADAVALDKEFSNLRDISESPGFLMSPEDQKTVKEGLAAYPKVIPLLEQAAACSDYDAQLDCTLPPQEFIKQSVELMSKYRDITRILDARVALLTAEGKYDEALHTALLILRLARHFDHNPMIADFLVTTAIRNIGVETANAVLQTGLVSKEVRDALDAELALQEPLHGYSRAIKGDRAFFLDSFSSTVPNRNFWLFFRGYWNLQESNLLDVFQDYLALSVDLRPYRQVESSINGISGKTWGLSRTLFPAINAIQGAVVGSRAMIRSLRVLNALQVHATAGSKEIPKLSDLGLPAETTTDPFTGEPLHVKRLPKGWLVYSVGWNYQDDGGDLSSPFKDVGVGPPPPAAKAAGKQATKGQ
jgi:hypothetical protein